MLTDILFPVVGASIGWSVPQPSWAKRLSVWAEGKLAMAVGRIR